MIRYSQLAKLGLQARYVVDHKKPIVDMPKNKPPKYVYEIKYHPAANPGIDMGFPDHAHINPFTEVAGSKHENFRYSYAGEWWEGHTLFKFIMFSAPAIFYYLFAESSKDNHKIKKSDCFNSISIDTMMTTSSFVPKRT